MKKEQDDMSLGSTASGDSQRPAVHVAAPHVCREDKSCRCYMLADEPSEDCPMHGFAMPRCECGRFVARKGLL